MLFSSIDAALYLFDHVEVVLDVFERALVWQILEQRLDFLFCGTHVEVARVASIGVHFSS